MVSVSSDRISMMIFFPSRPPLDPGFKLGGNPRNEDVRKCYRMNLGDFEVKRLSAILSFYILGYLVYCCNRYRVPLDKGRSLCLDSLSFNQKMTCGAFPRDLPKLSGYEDTGSANCIHWNGVKGGVRGVCENTGRG